MARAVGGALAICAIDKGNVVVHLTVVNSILELCLLARLELLSLADLVGHTAAGAGLTVGLGVARASRHVDGIGSAL